MKTLLTLLGGLVLCTAAQAQTAIALTTAAPSPFTALEPLGCNVANTVCRYTDAATHAMKIVVAPQSALFLTVDDTAYTVTQATSTVLVNTLYREVFDLEYTLAPTATLSGTKTMARSGSGRGGWAWHTHLDFSVLTIY
ncbi:hypothetical protein ACG04R_04670 [Roseateles sp. BYS78W]|uniref:Uncharacterized protein n=1 Tax=Pelomonas candidula TaxID=3299025 RepID=A0ABW7H7S3_9BURK